MQKYTLAEHFKELKFRLYRIVIFYILFAIISYFYSEEIYLFLLKPLAELNKDGKIIYTGLAEAFITYIKLSLFMAFILSIPLISLEIYLFLAPGLYKREKKIIAFSLIMVPILFYLGFFCLYYLILPKAFTFFISFENKSMMPLILEARISEYLSLVMELVIAFGIAFELPIILLILTLLGIITDETLRKRRRIAIVINFIIAALLTPPDILSQFGLALPLLLLYEISIIICKIVKNEEDNHVKY